MNALAHWVSFQSSFILATGGSFCIQAVLCVRGCSKDHTAAKMLLMLKEQMCVWLYFAFLQLVAVITTEPTLKEQGEEANSPL